MPVCCGSQLGSVKDFIELESASRDLEREEALAPAHAKKLTQQRQARKKAAATQEEKNAAAAKALAQATDTKALEPKEVEREITVFSEHANCPDAQCPRAKVYNVGYIGKAYNIIYGNPYPENAGASLQLQLRPARSHVH